MLWKQSQIPEKGIRGPPTHLLVIADTQVLDTHSMPSVSPWLRRLVHFIIESNSRKGWIAALNLKPDGLVFLGDMINGGRYARSDEEYDAFTAKFKDIFTFPSNTPAYYVVGNHDVGLGRSNQFSQRARTRFTRSFNVSSPNRVVHVGNHSLVFIDSPGLVEEDYRRANSGKVYPLRSTPRGAAKKGGKVKEVWTPTGGGTMEFIKKVAQERESQANPLPLILFSHIPLARPERSGCGPLRESQGARSHIQKGAGPGYQNLVGKATSTWILESLEPNAIFTADDHDYCEIAHSYLGRRRADAVLSAQGEQDYSSAWSTKRVKETTVKAFSMTTGIRRPGVQLLSLWNPVSAPPLPDVEPITPLTSLHTQSHLPTFSGTVCLLPDQKALYFYGYLPLILLSFALLTWLNLKTSPHHSKLSLTTPHNKSLPFFDTPGNAWFYDTPSTVDVDNGSDDDMPHRYDIGTGRTNSRQGLTLRHHAITGLRNPNLGGSSPFPSPLLSPMLVTPGIGGDSENGNDDGDTPDGRGESHGHAGGGGAGDEEKGFTSAAFGSRGIAILRTPTSPASPWNDLSYTCPSSPTNTARSRKWYSGGWRRGSSRGVFGQPGVGLALVGSDRKREEASGIRSGWRRIRSSGGGVRSLLARVMKLMRWCWRVVAGIVIGRKMRAANGSTDVFWKRIVWDALCVAVPSWVCFGLVTWWFIW